MSTCLRYRWHWCCLSVICWGWCSTSRSYFWTWNHCCLWWLIWSIRSLCRQLILLCCWVSRVNICPSRITSICPDSDLGSWPGHCFYSIPRWFLSFWICRLPNAIPWSFHLRLNYSASAYHFRCSGFRAFWPFCSPLLWGQICVMSFWFHYSAILSNSLQSLLNYQ